MRLNNLKFVILMLASVVLISGCFFKKNTVDNSSDVSEAISSSSQVAEQPKTVENPLTGLPMPLELKGKKPLSIMINDHQKAMPQAGVIDADIIYEAPAEGGINRLMGIFSDYENLSTVGPVRSTRDYYIDFAQNHYAIFIHMGGSPQAYSELKIRDINSIDFITNSAGYWRDEQRKKNKGLEHSAMTNGKLLKKVVDAKNFSTDLPADYKSVFAFRNDEESQGDIAAGSILIPYSDYYTASFMYNTETKQYLRFHQFTAKEGRIPQVDANNNEQLSFKNIFIVYVECGEIAGDDKERLEMKTTGTGTGFYISDGKAIDIGWKKLSHKSPISFTTANGFPLMINKGKSWICMVPVNVKQGVEIKALNS